MRIVVPVSVVVTLLGACSTSSPAGGAADAELCTPGERLCIGESLFSCESGGNVELVEACGGGCADGACIVVAVPEVGSGSDDAVEPDPVDGGPAGPEGACDVADAGEFQTAVVGRIPSCLFDCKDEPDLPAKQVCYAGCLSAVLSTGCAECAAGWLGCLPDKCGSACGDMNSQACRGCASTACDPAFEACSGLDADETIGASPDEGGTDGTTDNPNFVGGAACSAADYQQFELGGFWEEVAACRDECEHADGVDTPDPDESCLAKCLDGTISAGCAGCMVPMFVCFETDCKGPCNDGHESPGCEACRAEACYPDFLECSGIDMASVE